MEGLQIDVKNFSKLEWKRANWEVGAGRTSGLNWTDEITATPAEKLKPKVGATTGAAHSVHMTFLMQDALWIWLGYGISNAAVFHVRLKQRFHFVGIGPQAQWSRVDMDHNWNKFTTDTAKYIWEFESTVVEATPTLSNSGGSVSILITDRTP